MTAPARANSLNATKEIKDNVNITTATQILVDSVISLYDVFRLGPLIIAVIT